MKHSIEELLDLLQRLSGMRVTLYDKEFRCIFSPPVSASHLQFCSLIHQCSDCLAICLSSDCEAKKQCQLQRKLYRYRCPFGLFEAIVPLLCGDEVEGYMMVGQSLPIGDKAEQEAKDAVLPYLSRIGDAASLSAAVHQLPRHTSDQYQAVCDALCLFGDWISEEDLLPKTVPSVERSVWQYLRKHYGERITLADLSMVCHCSSVTLTERFRRTYGKTIMQELNEIRLTRARDLLQNSILSVDEIAWRCGFSDSGYFRKRFHAAEGVSPTEWRHKQTVISEHVERETEHCLKVDAVCDRSSQERI